MIFVLCSVVVIQFYSPPYFSHLNGIPTQLMAFFPHINFLLCFSFGGDESQLTRYCFAKKNIEKIKKKKEKFIFQHIVEELLITFYACAWKDNNKDSN